MAQLIVRKLEDRVVAALKKRAAKNGVSVEEEHRRILQQTLLARRRTKPSFKEFLTSAPYFDDEMVRLVNQRRRDKPRRVDLS